MKFHYSTKIKKISSIASSFISFSLSMTKLTRTKPWILSKAKDNEVRSSLEEEEKFSLHEIYSFHENQVLVLSTSRTLNYQNSPSTKSDAH